MKLLVSLGILFFSFCNLVCQVKYDNKLLFGEDQGVVLNFENGDPVVENNPIDFRLSSANSSICDENGDLLFYTNGCHIFNKNFEIMQNGDTISNSGFLHVNWCGGSGSPLIQSVLTFPRPNHPFEYFVLHNDISGQAFPGQVYYSIVDMSKENGLGAVVSKDSVIYSGNISRSNMIATKHRNGLDWWVLFPLRESNGYLKFLITEEGVALNDEQFIGLIWDSSDLQGQHTFSPNASSYARVSFSNGLNIFDFDNLNGELSNPEVIEFDFVEQDFFAGISFSPNSQFLYTSLVDNLFQYDLLAENVANSRVHIGKLETPDSLMFQTSFYNSFLGPNGKIYLGGHFQFNYLHVIHYPNCKGLNSTLEQYAIKLDEFPGFSSNSVPNIPHFRNQPSDIVCDTLNIMNTGSTTIENSLMLVELFPNPASNYLNIKLPNTHQIESISIFDVFGIKKMYLENISSERLEVSLDLLEEGVFFCEIISGDRSSILKKVIVAK